jgi:hypothetical protein
VPAEEEALAFDDTFLRRVLHRADFVEWHEDFDCWVPSLAGVRFDPDGMSAFVSRLLSRRAQGPAEVSTLGGTSDKLAVVYEFDGAAARDSGFDASLSPNDDTPIGHAHASLQKPTLTKSQERVARTRLAARMTLVHGTIDLPKPDGA